jgi:hypothetical protein
VPFGDTIKTRVILQKMCIMHKDGSFESVDDSQDYLAVHAFCNSQANSAIIEDKDPLCKSIFSRS